MAKKLRSHIKRQLDAKISFIQIILQTHKQDKWNMFFDSLDHKKGSIYKLNKSLLNKLQQSHLLTGPNGLVFTVTDKAELMAYSLERQFTTNSGPDIP